MSKPMTVEQLIGRLSKLDPKAAVVLNDGYYGGEYWPIETVRASEGTEPKGVLITRSAGSL